MQQVWDTGSWLFTKVKPCCMLIITRCVTIWERPNTVLLGECEVPVYLIEYAPLWLSRAKKETQQIENPIRRQTCWPCTRVAEKANLGLPRKTPVGGQSSTSTQENRISSLGSKPLSHPTSKRKLFLKQSSRSTTFFYLTCIQTPPISPFSFNNTQLTKVLKIWTAF